MTTYIDLATGRRISEVEPFVAALGDFDGVHLGHRRVISAAKDGAAALGVKSAVWTFADSPKTSSPRITGPREKELAVASLGADYLILEDFAAVKDLSPEEFVDRYLVPLGAVGAVCGFNFRFGRGAAGDGDALGALCRERSLYFCTVPPVEVDGAPVSSTRIREALSRGDAEAASKMLGAPYSLTRTVTHGRTIGRRLGAPTVNLDFSPCDAVPRHGVYFSYTAADGKIFPSVSNVGRRPTVGGHVLRLETHILDETLDLYGRDVTVSLLKFRRAEVCFSSNEELSRAIKEDIEAAHEYFDGIKSREEGKE